MTENDSNDFNVSTELDNNNSPTTHEIYGTRYSSITFALEIGKQDGAKYWSVDDFINAARKIENFLNNG